MTAGSALVIGGTGQVGRATVSSLADAGWRVTVVSRGELPAYFPAEAISADRNDDAAMDAALRRGFDVVVDLVAQRKAHADQLIRNADSIGSAIMLSSAAVYRDARGMTLMEAMEGNPERDPQFHQIVSEQTRAVDPSEDDYPGRKRTIEQLLLDSRIPTTVLRPAAIHGPFSPQPREWFYVRRVLDGRRIFVLGYGGKSALHTASTGNIAEMIRLAAQRPGARILNAGDPDYPDEYAISSAIADAMGVEVTHVLVPGAPPVASPWSLSTPFFLSTAAAERELGYRAVETYAASAVRTCAWIALAREDGSFDKRLDARFGGSGVGFKVMAGEGRDPFEYAREARAIQHLAVGAFM